MTATPTQRVTTITAVRTAILVIATFFVLAACGGEAELAGYEREPEPTVGTISLPVADADAREFAFKAEPGKLLMVTFGYTNCPDICPTTLADTRLAFAELGARSEDVDLAWVSIDPNRDTAEVASNYVQTFVQDGIAIRTDDADRLAIAADAFGASYTVIENDEGEIEVGHTGFVYLVDDTGSIVLTWQVGVQATDIASDLNVFLDRRA